MANPICPPAGATRRLNGKIDGPPGARDPVPKKFFRQSGVPDEFSHSVFRAFVDDNNVGVPVVRLFSLRGPTAIAWIVTLLPVQAIKRVSQGRPHSHIGEEALKPAGTVVSVPPSIADGNPAPGVMGMPAIRHGLAPVNHSLIGRQGWRPSPASRVAVGEPAALAPTRVCMPGRKFAGRLNLLAAAGANAAPKPASAIVGAGSFYDRHHSKLSPGKICQPAHLALHNPSPWQTSPH